MTKFSRRGLLAALTLGSFALTSPAFAHEAPCPFCSMAITQDTPQEDNETVLKFGRKRVEYKCVYCALAEAQTEYKGDLTILAPSEKKGEPVKITRTGDKWAAATLDAVFVAQKGSHRVCQVIYRAFTSKAGFDAWVKAHPQQFEAGVKPLSLTEMLAKSK